MSVEMKQHRNNKSSHNITANAEKEVRISISGFHQCVKFVFSSWSFTCKNH